MTLMKFVEMNNSSTVDNSSSESITDEIIEYFEQHQERIPLLLFVYVLTIVWIVYCILYNSRVQGRLISYFLQRFYFKDAAQISFDSFSVRFISGSILFRNLSYSTGNYFLFVRDGSLLFRYWSRETKNDLTRLSIVLNKADLCFFGPFPRSTENSSNVEQTSTSEEKNFLENLRNFFRSVDFRIEKVKFVEICSRKKVRIQFVFFIETKNVQGPIVVRKRFVAFRFVHRFRDDANQVYLFDAIEKRARTRSDQFDFQIELPKCSNQIFAHWKSTRKQRTERQTQSAHFSSPFGSSSIRIRTRHSRKSSSNNGTRTTTAPGRLENRDSLSKRTENQLRTLGRSTTVRSNFNICSANQTISSLSFSHDFITDSLFCIRTETMHNFVLTYRKGVPSKDTENSNGNAVLRTLSHFLHQFTFDARWFTGS